jgi:DNA-binding beta-propeller fold protein YncE
MRVWMSVLLSIPVACACRGEMPLEKTIAPVRAFVLPRVEGRLDHMAIDVASGRLLISALGSNAVAIVELQNGRMASTLSGGLPKPQGIAVGADVERILVACEFGGTCRIFETREYRELLKVDLASDADNVRYDRAAKRFWVGYGSGGLVAVDPMTGEKGTDIKLESHPESFQLEAKGKRIFVNVPVAGHIAVIDREKGAVIEKWKPRDAASYFPMALDEENHRLFVGCRKPATFLVLDIETGKTVMAAECVADCDDLFYDAEGKQVYISGDGHVSVFRRKEANQYELVANVVTGEGARTSLFDPATGLLYVAVPHRESQRAEVRVYDLRAMP